MIEDLRQAARLDEDRLGTERERLRIMQEQASLVGAVLPEAEGFLNRLESAQAKGRLIGPPEEAAAGGGGPAASAPTFGALSRGGGGDDAGGSGSGGGRTLSRPAMPDEDFLVAHCELVQQRIPRPGNPLAIQQGDYVTEPAWRCPWGFFFVEDLEAKYGPEAFPGISISGSSGGGGEPRTTGGALALSRPGRPITNTVFLGDTGGGPGGPGAATGSAAVSEGERTMIAELRGLRADLTERDRRPAADFGWETRRGGGP